MFSSKKTMLRTIKPGDPKCLLRDEYIVAPRAGFEIDQRCPHKYKEVIAICIEYGWLKPTANVYDNELFWEELQR